MHVVAYLLSKRGAKHLLQHALPARYPIDDAAARTIKDTKMNAFMAARPIVRHLGALINNDKTHGLWKSNIWGVSSEVVAKKPSKAALDSAKATSQHSSVSKDKPKPKTQPELTHASTQNSKGPERRNLPVNPIKIHVVKSDLKKGKSVGSVRKGAASSKQSKALPEKTVEKAGKNVKLSQLKKK